MAAGARAHNWVRRETFHSPSMRESRSRPDAGLVEFHHRAYNQHGDLVAECRRQAFMRKKPKDV